MITFNEMLIIIESEDPGYGLDSEDVNGWYLPPKQKIHSGTINPHRKNSYYNFKLAVEKRWGGPINPSMIMTDEFISQLGYTAGELIKSGVIVRSNNGFMLAPNRDDYGNPMPPSRR